MCFSGLHDEEFVHNIIQLVEHDFKDIRVEGKLKEKSRRGVMLFDK